MLVAAVRLNFWERRPRPPTKTRQAEHQQQVADDAAGDRRLDELDVALTQRDDGDDQLRRVAERGVEKPAEHRSRIGARAASVPSPITPASGTSETAAVRKIHGDPGATTASTQHTGAAMAEG